MINYQLKEYYEKYENSIKKGFFIIKRILHILYILSSKIIKN